MRSPPWIRRHGVWLVLAAAATGCSSNEQPSYTVGSAPPGTAQGSSSSAPGESSAPHVEPVQQPAFAKIVGKKADGDGATFTVGGKKFPAPSGRAFEVGLARDVDGDGKDDLVAWARSPDGKRAELVLANGTAPEDARTVIALPGGALGSAGCKPSAALSLIGPALVGLDLGCSEKREQGPRWVAAISLAPGGGDAGAERGPILVELALGARPDGEAIDLSLSTVKREGKEAVAIAFTLKSVPKPLENALPVTAQIVLVDGGGSHTPDPNEPEVSLGRVAGSLVADARRRTAAGHVDADAVALGRLRAILCASASEKGGGKVLPMTTCGEPKALGEAMYARVLAAQSRGEPLKAYAAYDPSGIYGRKHEAEVALDKLVPKVAATQKKLTTVALLDEGGVVPVAFDGAGALLVRTKSGAVKLDASFAENPEASDPFPKAIALKVSGENVDVVKATGRCDAPTPALALKKGGPVALPILGAQTKSCGAVLPLAWIGLHEDGTTVFASGARLIAIGSELKAGPGELLGSAAKPGSARSPDGTVSALVTPRGVLVVTAAGAKLFDHASLRGKSGLACAPQNGGKRIACASPDGVAVYDAP